MSERALRQILIGALAVIIGCIPKAGLTETFDPVQLASERCLMTAIAGRPVDVAGLRPVDPETALLWTEGDRKARVYYGSENNSNQPVPNPVMVVHSTPAKPRCEIVYSGLDRKAYHRLTDRFAKQKGVAGPAEGGAFDGESEVRVYSLKGTSFLLVAISVPFLKSVTVLVVSPRAFANRGEG